MWAPSGNCNPVRATWSAAPVPPLLAEAGRQRDDRRDIMLAMIMLAVPLAVD
jgi:hypothetical protein